MDYPLPKLDLMYEARKGMAMENWGLVLFAPRTLLLDPATATEEETWLVVNVIAHELSHQVLAATRMITESANISAANRSIGSTTGCAITEKAPTRAFSWLKAATTAFTFKTLC